MLKPLLAAVFLILSGCGSVVKPPPAIPDEFTKLCAQPEPLLDGKHATVEVWAIRTVTDYRECAERHRYLVESIKRREAIY